MQQWAGATGVSLQPVNAEENAETDGATMYRQYAQDAQGNGRAVHPEGTVATADTPGSSEQDARKEGSELQSGGIESLGNDGEEAGVVAVRAQELPKMDRIDFKLFFV